MVHQFCRSRENGKPHMKWGLIRIRIWTRLNRIIGVHIRRPIVGFYHFVHPKKWCARRQWSNHSLYQQRSNAQNDLQLMVIQVNDVRCYVYFLHYISRNEVFIIHDDEDPDINENESKQDLSVIFLFFFKKIFFYLTYY